MIRLARYYDKYRREVNHAENLIIRAYEITNNRRAIPANPPLEEMTYNGRTKRVVARSNYGAMVIDYFGPQATFDLGTGEVNTSVRSPVPMMEILWKE